MRTLLSCVFCLWVGVACSTPPKPATSEPEKAAPRPAESKTAEAPEPKKAPVDPHVHEYWGAIVTLGDKPPWAALADGAPKDSPLGTMKTDPAALPSGLPSHWKPGKTLTMPAGKLASVAFSPDEKSVAALDSSSGKLYFFDPAKGKVSGNRTIADYSPGEPASFTFVRELELTDRIVVARRSGVFLVLDKPEDGRRLGRAAAGTNVEYTERYGLYGIDALRDGGSDIYLQWLTSELAARISCKQPALDWSLSEDGKTIAVLYEKSEMVEIIELQQRRLLAEFPSPPDPRTLAVSPSGNVVALGGTTLVLFSLTTGQVILTDTSFKEPVEHVRFSPQEDLLLVRSGNAVHSYALPKKVEELAALPKPQVLEVRGASIADIRTSVDGRHLVIGGSDGKLRLWSR
jgi:WD40 repeat protein